MTNQLEEFQTWWDEKGFIADGSIERCFITWKARQPTIDALKRDISSLLQQNAALKAEVERLANEREKVFMQSGRNDALLFENAQLAGRLMKYEEPERYAAYCKALDDKIAALKETK